MSVYELEYRVADLGGPVHYADFGGSGPPIVLVHGLGGALQNWLCVAPRLRAHGRVLALDLAGHGRTPSRGRTARVGANRLLLDRFLAVVAGAPAVVIGNSMGGYLALAEAAAEPARVSALVLVDAAVPLAPGGGFDRGVLALFAAMATPVLGEALMLARSRRSPESRVRDLLLLCGVDHGTLARDVYEAHVAVATEHGALGRRAAADFLAAQRSLMNRLLRRRKFFEMVAGIRAPALVIQGDRDRLVRLPAARALAAERPDWRLEVLEGVGHVPQLQVPDRFLAIVEPWLRTHS
ncbi:alpha/beta fold hydrolase [Anaeromyxobacter oryzae]|uniref:Hydrolase n=1 Tax=Anaeromyxobacter oryzae TaxID=2918170 RepID=A0ABM7WZW0_9BACT|nr:alpha/beta hydrolase [Anaeromyxobacter oryzae]BDG05093.1 hydrolase [Anaeromyxobacter oryzae]